MPTVCLQSAEGAALGAAIQGAFANHAVNGDTATFRDLCSRLVKTDPATRAEPDDDRREHYAKLLARQSDLTRRLHAAGYL